MKTKYIVMIIMLASFFGCSAMNPEDKAMINKGDGMLENTEVATFGGGCFWCIEAPFEDIDGVLKVVSGYTGGSEQDPSYQEVSSGTTGHIEAVQIYYNPAIISYAEILDLYWKLFDPTDDGGSFHDRGSQYKSAIYHKDEYQKNVAMKSKQTLDKSGVFDKPIVTKILPYKAFFIAEEYHQDFYKKDSARYCSYKEASGRESFIEKTWGKKAEKEYIKPSDDILKQKLTKEQYEVTQMNSTEQCFRNSFWDNKGKGIYVDVVTGEPLFSSTDKFDSGTGWPSFSKPIDPRHLTKIEDNSHFMQRVEVKSKVGNSHLGHVFTDGPDDTKLRYCINSASLRFIPFEEMKEEGYEDYIYLFEKKM